MKSTLFDCRISGFGRKRKCTLYVPNDQSPMEVITAHLVAHLKGDSAEWHFNTLSPVYEAIYFGIIYKGDKVLRRGFLHIPLDY